MNTTTICASGTTPPLSHFPCDLSTLRETTRASFAAYVAAHDLEAANEGALPLLESVEAVRFVENPLDALDLLRANEQNELVRETVLSLCDDSFVESEPLWTLELFPWHDQTLVVVAPEAIALLQPLLAPRGGAGTPMGAVERFALTEATR